MSELNFLMEEIELLRREMSQTSFKEGLNSNKMIEISQKLDKMLNLYNQKNKK